MSLAVEEVWNTDEAASAARLSQPVVRPHRVKQTWFKRVEVYSIESLYM